MSRFSCTRFILALAAIVASPNVAHAQRADRPRLAIDFQGPAGKTRALGFLPQGDRIFAAGEGKTIEFYDLQQGRVTLAPPGRWEFARGGRGEINDAVLTADGRYALIGGFSARGERDVVVMDVATRGIVAALPGAATGAPDSKAHSFSAILSVAVAPNAQFAASASYNGEVWLWDLRRGFGNATGRQLRSAGAEPVEFNPVAFTGNTGLLYSAPLAANGALGSGTYGVYQLDLRSQQVSRLPESYGDAVTAISTSADGGHICVCGHDGAIAVRRQGVVSPVSTFTLPDTGLLRNAVVSPDGSRVAIMGDTQDRARSFLSLVDTAQIQIVDTVQFPEREACVAAAFSNDGRSILSHDDSREFLLLWKLIDPNGVPLGRPLKQAPLAIGGRGQKFVAAKFLQDRSTGPTGYHIQAQTAEERQQFSLSDGGIEPTVNTPLITGETFAAGWRIQFVPGAGGLVYRAMLTSPRNSRHVITVKQETQGELTGAYCFIPDATGRPAAVALGTRTLDGIYVYSLHNTAQQVGEEVGLLRYFRDHSGEILDLSVSQDGRFLLSTARDKTIKVWSLQGLYAGGRQSVYGATFAPASRALIAKNVLKPGIVFGRKIRENDRIIRVEDMSVPEGGVTDVGQMSALLQRHSPFKPVWIWTERLGAGYRPGGDDDRIVMVPGWEPLLTLVMDKTGEWVMFTPEGYYNASPADGHRLFGWQFNLGRDQTPRFEPAGNLQKAFEKPGIMRDVLQLGSVADALAAAGQPVPGDFQVALADKIQTLPEIQITAPADNTQVGANRRVTLQASVRFPNGTPPQNFDVKADVGGRTLGPAQAVVQNGVHTYSWESEVVDLVSQFRVSAKEKNGSITTSLATDRIVTVKAAAKAELPQPRMYVIAFGAEKYKFQEVLQFAIDDATGVFSALQDHPERYHDFSDLSVLRTNNDVRKATLERDVSRILADIQKRKNPDDLIIVYATGHGVLGSEDKTFYYLPPHVNNENASELRQEGIAWADFAEMVNDAPCNVIWSIDACHAGAASDTAKKTLNRDSAGTGRRCVFLSTSEANELARENQFAMVRESDKGHGWFSMAFIETLIGNDFDPEEGAKANKLRADGSLTTDEVGKYVFHRVKEATSSNQRPVFTPKFIEPSTSVGQPITLLSAPTP